MQCSYHPGYHVVLPDSHPFPISKYPQLRNQLLAEGVLAASDLVRPEPLDRETLELVHTRGYLDKLEGGTLSAVEQRRLGLPWSDSLWMRSRLAAAGTLLAAQLALRAGLAGNLAGGTHHAFADHGEGFCVLNDVAIAIARLRHDRHIERALIVDLDVHQGNGTAAIFERDADVFTFSMHGARNYPAHKMTSTLDVALADGVGDAEYLRLLDANLPLLLSGRTPHIAFYVAGVDVAAGDRYGRLALSESGIRERDRRVIEFLRGAGVPLVLVMAGGYSPTQGLTAQLHAHAFREAVAYEREHPATATSSGHQ